MMTPINSEDEASTLITKDRGLLSLFTITDDYEGTENGWSVENKRIFNNLSEDIHKSSFIYQYVLERLRRNRGRLVISSYICSGSTGVASTITSVLNASSNIVMGLGVAGAVLGGIGLLLTWMSKNYYGYDELIEKCTAYIAKLDILYMDFGRVSTTPPSQRQGELSASSFLTAMRLKKDTLFREEPSVDQSLLLEGSKAFSDKKMDKQYV